MIFHKMNAESFRVFPYQGVIRILYKMSAESSRGHYFLVIIDSYIKQIQLVVFELLMVRLLSAQKTPVSNNFFTFSN